MGVYGGGTGRWNDNPLDAGVEAKGEGGWVGHERVRRSTAARARAGTRGAGADVACAIACGNGSVMGQRNERREREGEREKKEKGEEGER